jgi:hypothetical protein
VLAYIHDTDVETLNRLLYARTPEEVVATFPYLSDREKQFACRALFDQWAERLAAGGRPMLPHLMEWMTRQRFNGHAGHDTPSSTGAPISSNTGASMGEPALATEAVGDGAFSPRDVLNRRLARAEQCKSRENRLGERNTNLRSFPPSHAATTARKLASGNTAD